MRRRPGAAFAIASSARCTMPSFAPGGRARGVLLLGDAEQDHRRDPELLGLLARLGELVDRLAEDARHRRHLVAHAAAGDDEERQHEVVARDARLAHEPAELRRWPRSRRGRRDERVAHALRKVVFVGSSSVQRAREQGGERRRRSGLRHTPRHEKPAFRAAASVDGTERRGEEAASFPADPGSVRPRPRTSGRRSGS